MLISFLIIAGENSKCSMKRAGDSVVRRFTTVNKAVAAARCGLHGEQGKITIADVASGALRIIRVAPRDVLNVG